MTSEIEVRARWRIIRAADVLIRSRYRYRSGGDIRLPLLIEDVVLATVPLTLLEPGTEMVLA